jgi:hypothetical protein
MSKTVFTFGRMNPPTIGHQKLVDKVKAEAKKQGAMPHVYLSHTQNAKRDPLDYNTKIKFARKAFGPSVTKSASKTIIQVLQEIEKMGHTEVTLVVGSDRVNDFKTFLNKYNGKDYTFEKIKVMSAGQRDPDAEGTAGMSATKIRGLAQAGELEEFGKGLPSTLQSNDAKAIYNKVRNVMGITESVEVEDEDFEFTEAELDAFIEMTDLDSLDEHVDIDEEFEVFLEEMELSERAPLTVPQRLAIGRRMKRLAPRMARKRAIQKKKMADKPRLEKRARKAAIKLLRTKFAGKQGANYASLAPGAKISVDRIIQKKMSMVNTISKRMLPKVRKAEMDRLKRARGSKKVVGTANEALDLQFELFLKESSVVELILEDEDNETNQKLLYMLRQAFTDATERQLVVRALKGGAKSLQNPKLRPFILKLLNRLLDATQSDPTMFVKMKDRLRRMAQDDSKKEVEEAQDPDIKDREGTQPAKYHAGLKKSTKTKRDAHFKKQGDKPDDQASAYKPAPGDATAKTKTSKHTNKFKAMYGEDMDIAFEKFISEEYIEEKALDGLKKKAEKSGIPYGILKKVYDRGMAAWKTGHRPGTTPQQWAYARVNSFATKSKGTWGGADKDLASRVREEVEEATTHSWKSEGHYLENGQEWTGDQHNYDNNIWTGKEHTKDSQKLYHYKELPSKLRDKIDMKVDQMEARKSPLQRLKDFDKTRVAVGKRPIFDPKSTEFRNVSKKQKRLDQTSNEDVDATKEKIAREKEADKVKHDAMMDRARTSETQAKNRSTNESLDDAFTAFLNEVGGAGEFGTDKLKKKYSKDTPYAEEMSCWCGDDNLKEAELEEAEYKGRKVELNNPSRSSDGKKKFYVYVRNDKGNIIKLGFGDPNMEIKRDDPARRKAFRARHSCDDNIGPKWKARYWSCYQWRAGAKVDN